MASLPRIVLIGLMMLSFSACATNGQTTDAGCQFWRARPPLVKTGDPEDVARRLISFNEGMDAACATR